MIIKAQSLLRFVVLAFAFGSTAELIAAHPSKGHHARMRQQREKREARQEKQRQLEAANLQVKLRRLDHEDPFEPLERFRSGPFAGQQVDSSRARSIKILSKSEFYRHTGKALDSQSIGVANFGHKDTFWIAQIPVQKIKSIIFQSEVFPAVVPAAHSQLRIVFNDDACVQLYPQTTLSHALDVECVDDLLYSIEATSTVYNPQSYDLFKGQKHGYFVNSYRLISLDQKIDAMLVEKQHIVKQYLLKLSAEETVDVFLSLIKVSSDSGHTTYYNTLSESCTTELYRVFDKVVVSKKSSLRQLSKTIKVLPIFPETYLKARALLDRRLPDLNDEFVGR